MKCFWVKDRQGKSQITLTLLIIVVLTSFSFKVFASWTFLVAPEGVSAVQHCRNFVPPEALDYYATGSYPACNWGSFLTSFSDGSEGYITGTVACQYQGKFYGSFHCRAHIFPGATRFMFLSYTQCVSPKVVVDGQCIDQRCPVSYKISLASGLCEAHCEIGQAWDATKQTCIDPPKEQTCKSQGPNPIDFIEGKKFRTEPVLTAGANSKISFTYFYNNQKNREKTASSTAPSAASIGSGSFNYANTYVAATAPPISGSEYQNTYNNYGFPNSSTDVLPNQHYGAFEQYWRHNFDEVLQIRGSEYILHTAKGQAVRFSGLGYNAIYPHLNLQLLAAGEESFTGFKITNVKANTIKKFDNTGRLLKIVRAANDALTLNYDTNNRLEHITHNDGAYIQLEYEEKPTKSIYSVTASQQSYPISVTSNTGEAVQLEWLHAYEGQTATFHMLTQKTNPSTSTATTGRVYEYNDPRWPASVTDIYDVSNIQNNTRSLYAHFDYDDKGRAVQSELANGYERVQVNYVDDNQRIVTNALGKNAIYNFADFNGVTRLQSVIGEATSSCAESNTVYDYYPEGALKTKTKNGVITHYEYNTRNLKKLETKAKGTLVEQVKKTCWHPTLNKPERIVEADRVTFYEYFDDGNLKNKRVERVSESNMVCD